MRNSTQVRWKIWTFPALAIALVAAAPVPEIERTGDGPAVAARIEVDLSERKLHVYSGDSRINTFEVAIGTEEHPTPTGEFTINRIIWNPAWVPPDVEWAEDETRKEPGDPDNPMQGAKIFFKYPDYYIHGTNAPGTLGTAASHGCLRMNEVDVENLAQFIQKAGGEDRSDEWFESIRSSETNKTEITLPDPVPISIHW